MLTDWNVRFDRPSADLAVIGGGLVGIVVAWYAAKAGLTVAVFEKAEPIWSSSSLPSGLISPLLVDPPLKERVQENLGLLRDFLAERGEEKRLHLSGSLLLADPEGGSALGKGQKGERSLFFLETFFHRFKEAEALQWLSSQELQREVPGLSPNIPAGVFYPLSAWINSLWLLNSLVEASLQQGVVFHFHSPVLQLIPTGRSFGIETPWETFPAGSVVIAAGVWSRHLLKQLGVDFPLVSRRVQGYQTFQGLNLPYPLLSGVWISSLIEDSQKVYTSPLIRPNLLPTEEDSLLIGEYLSVPGFDPLPSPEGTLSLQRASSLFYPSLEKAGIRKEFAFLGAFSLEGRPLKGSFKEVPRLFLATGYGTGGLSVVFAEARSLVSLVLQEG